jgi:hypothetical protein
MKKSEINLELMLFIYNFVLVINNILLELYNLINLIMKKSYLALIISAIVLATTILWAVSSKTTLGIAGIAQFCIIIVLVGFGVYVGLSRLKSERRGEPAEDEMSKKIMMKTSSTSFYISLYIWLAVMYYSDKTKLETHTLIGVGILGMAIVFLACWIFFKIRGMKDA